MVLMGSNDPYIGGLIKISEKIDNDPNTTANKAALGMIRFDYMHDMETDEPKLIEFNTIASSFGVLCDQVTKVQAQWIDRIQGQDFGYPDQDQMNARLQQINKTKEGICEAFKAAVDLYGDTVSTPVALILGEAEERNVVDQAPLVAEMYHKHGVKVRFMTHDEVHEKGSLNAETGVLTIRPFGDKFGAPEEVVLVYFRSAYNDSTYVSEIGWEAREMMELSKAIKCPNINIQLLTFKKVQEALCQDEIWNVIIGEADLEKFAPIRKFFTGMYSLDNLESEPSKSKVEDAIKNPHNYVLKTMGEGGGNNYFDEDIPIELAKKGELWQYSLMDKIYPKPFTGVFLNQGNIWVGESVSELGVFGSILIDSDGNEVLNKEIGGIMRSKVATEKEGGIMVGAAHVDSPLIIHD